MTITVIFIFYFNMKIRKKDRSHLISIMILMLKGMTWWTNWLEEEKKNLHQCHVYMGLRRFSKSNEIIHNLPQVELQLTTNNHWHVS